jgi:predicted ATPase/class 3 adenylate cyclase
MFADLVGSTALSARLDPEDMSGMLRAYQNAVTAEIGRNGGYVAKLMGDGVLAYFGWPRAGEDDAERAVRAGLSIVESVSAVSAPSGEPLAARVGIATGLVVVGEVIGEGAAREDVVVGETPNLAARLQGVAAPGTVVIADGTRRLLGEIFVLRALAPGLHKGFTRLVEAFEVVGERRAGTRFEVRQSGLASPMVGRDPELALVVERWRQARAGEGQAVLLAGEAGIGKSRLVQATLETIAGEEHVALRYQCSPRHTGTALWPVVQQLGFAADIAPADSEAVKLDKLDALLQLGADNIGAQLPLIAALLGLDASARYPMPDLTPAQRRARTLAALTEQLLGLAAHQPVLMVFEDVHWIDPTTLELLDQIIDRMAGARVLVLLTSRPDNQPSLSGHSRVTRLTLNRLGSGATAAMVDRLTSGRGLVQKVLSEIATRTDGVPLFVEELTKAVLEAGTTGTAAAVPASLYASLMARLDRIPEVKGVAQVASCIGREFGYSLLAAMSPLPEPELRAALDKLRAAELVFVRGTPPEARYSFKHALVRDAAYESLLKTDRQRLHAGIVRALEKHFPETVNREPEVLAQHCTEAGLAEPAVDYWQRAGQQARARSAMAEAVAHLTKGLEVLEKLPAGVQRQRRELGLQLALGQVSVGAKGFAAPETDRAYARARELCSELGDNSELLPALYGQSVVHLVRGELTAALELARELLRVAGEHGDATARVTGHRMIGSVLCQLGRFVESRENFEAALVLYDPVRDRTSAIVYAIDSRVMSLSWLSHLDFILGQPEQALARSDELPAYTRELAHANSAAVALAWNCIFHQLRSNRQNAQEQAESAIALATEQGFPLYRAAGTVVRGWALADNGQAEDGIAEIRRGLADYAATGAELWLSYFLGLLAEAEGRADRAGAGLSNVDEALARVERTGVRWFEAELYRLRGELNLALPEPDQPEADACFTRAMAVAREQKAKMWELRATMGFARLRREQNRGRGARDFLASIYDRFTEGFDTPDLREAKALLDELRENGERS